MTANQAPDRANLGRMVVLSVESPRVIRVVDSRVIGVHRPMALPPPFNYYIGHAQTYKSLKNPSIMWVYRLGGSRKG